MDKDYAHCGCFGKSVFRQANNMPKTPVLSMSDIDRLEVGL